jgi:hypothetical protein
MLGDAGDLDVDAIGGEGLVVDLADTSAIQRVGEGGAEFCDVDLVGTASDLLVGGEEDLDGAVPDFRVGRSAWRRRS